MKKLFGTGVALITPFTEKLEVDYKGLKKLLSHTAKGVDYYVVMGTTGESATVSKEEKKSILQFVKANNTKALPIVYGLGGNNTQEILDALKETDLGGVTAILSVSPYYNKPSQEGIYQHFKAIADASPVPVILYNVPGRTASNVTAETTLRLAEHKNIIGIKEASGNLEQCMRIAKYAPKDFLLISGDDMLTVPIYSIGGKGVISVLANAYPVIFRKMKDFSFSGDYGKASQELFKLLEVNGPMYEEGNPVGLKELLSQLEICSAAVRLPLAKASSALSKKISNAMV
ncbi:4-hydroxy-tetrahydrodipicolinate synthase [Chryseosolibacter indicus]|uniref:4-hydroxy-tetrahydrodipicolinate synthase n=1 Tax=Chryseosolibacter indicus TaxID=2782351 RepID=A0ABS5VLJ6_9BACT|nr:4-hydroxy-tetrahydrodipicolinate synthase [Chryseosolibacter indicus]MBT1701662.1 4-hydroxy-tetrahydrodipicolinate synthase [Chryseosolibacter indicus]